MRIFHCHVQKIVSIHQETKRTAYQPRPPASVSSREWQFESIRCGIRQPLDTVSREVVILSLLPVGDDGRACGLKLLDRLTDGFVVKWLQNGMRANVVLA